MVNSQHHHCRTVFHSTRASFILTEVSVSTRLTMNAVALVLL